MATPRPHSIKVIGVCIVLISLLLAGAFATVEAAYTIKPRLTISETYDSNLFLDPDHEEDDFITVISPGISFSYFEKTSGVLLDYQLDYTRFAENDDLNFVGHAGSLESWYSPHRNLQLKLDDYLVKGDDPRDRFEEQDIRVSKGRSTYVRNILRPSAVYKFGEKRELTLQYQNIYYTNDDPAIADSRENTYFAGIAYRFNVRHSAELHGSYFAASFDRTEPSSDVADFDGYNTGASYTYSFTRFTSAFLDGSYEKRDFESGSTTGDYDVVSLGTGVNHQFTRYLSMFSRVGYYWRDEEKGDSTKGSQLEVGLDGNGRYWRGGLRYAKGYEQVYFDRENLGFNEIWSVTGFLKYTVSSRLGLDFSASYTDEDFTDQDMERETWDLAANLEYGLLRWLSIGAGYNFLHRSSNDPEEEFIDHRVMLNLIFFYTYPPGAAKRGTSGSP